MNAERHFNRSMRNGQTVLLKTNYQRASLNLTKTFARVPCEDPGDDETTGARERDPRARVTNFVSGSGRAV